MPPSDASLTKSKTILCIDDEPGCLRLYQQILHDAGYQVVSFTDGQAGLEYLTSAHVDLVVVDYSMPQLSGAEVARSIREINPSLPVIMVSSWPECPGDARHWVNLYLVKVEGVGELPGSIERLLAADVA